MWVGKVFPIDPKGSERLTIIVELPCSYILQVEKKMHHFIPISLSFFEYKKLGMQMFLEVSGKQKIASALIPVERVHFGTDHRFLTHFPNELCTDIPYPVFTFPLPGQ